MPAPERTTHEDIVRAATELLEEHGVDGLTMQAVAVRVGVRAPSLYKRFRDRGAVVAAVAETAVDDLGALLEESATDLRALAVAYRAFAKERPEAFRLVFTPAAPLDALERAAMPVVTAAAALVGDGAALSAARTFTAWATGFLHMELAGAFRLGGDVDAAFDYGLDRLVAGMSEATAPLAPPPVEPRRA
ncbi:TetR/AcrR family transcriptional regulator [Sanguibacter sp. A247]|uniref:TetR/AcrR family transcriptional regulator n=1 Tax=unclassified Sanguibacter TaxID=2645534 RepID=UPI003FD715D7